MIIYLAGNIQGCTKDEARGWRDQATEFLNGYEIKTLDPCRGKDDFRRRYEPKEIVLRDLRDIDSSSLILAKLELDENSHGTGTSMEIMFAWLNRIPVVLVTKNKALARHYWIQAFVTRVFEDLQDALDYIVEYWRTK